MLSMLQTAGLLQRFMPHHNAMDWLARDRRHSPLIPDIQVGADFIYPEEDVIRFAQRLSHNAVFRNHRCRRMQSERRLCDRERRQISDRRYKHKHAGRHNLDRRGDPDRRILGWVDRRCVEERRA